MNGLILLDKPPGITSARAVAIVKRHLPKQTKVGHAGTLDPFASGLLILLIGNATRQCEKVMSWTKVYEATIRLGAISPTDDIDSPQVVENKYVTIPSPEQISRALTQFQGLVKQRPPVYSAIKIAGTRACDRIRAGQSVDLLARTVRIDSIELLEYEWPRLHVEVTCGRGTYIRAIARDLGEILKVGGLLAALRRTRIGDFDVRDSCTLDKLNPATMNDFCRSVGI